MGYGVIDQKTLDNAMNTEARMNDECKDFLLCVVRAVYGREGGGAWGIGARMKATTFFYVC